MMERRGGDRGRDGVDPEGYSQRNHEFVHKIVASSLKTVWTNVHRESLNVEWGPERRF